MRISRLTAVTAMVVGLVLTLSGCTPSGPGQTSGKTLTVGMTLEPMTLDLTTSDAASIPQLLLYNVYETLIKTDANGTIKPLLATDYEVSTDAKTYTFHLDPQASFASGTPVDAAAVVASLDRVRQGVNKTIQSSMAVVDTIAATDTHTVTITLKQPSNLWLYAMTSTPGIIVDPATNDLATAPMGSGPYAYDSWTKGDRISLKKNTAYWATPGRFDHVVFRYIPDPNAMVSAMLSGDLDIVGEMTSPDSLSQFSDTSKFTVVSGTTNGEIVLGFNHARATLQNLAVRQAICYAIDRQGLVDAVWGGQGKVIGSMTVPTDSYFEDLATAYPYDPQKAKDLLTEAGVSGLTLSLRVPITPYAPAAATFIASQLAQVGITATVEELDFSSRWLPEVYLGGDYDMTIVAHVEARDIVNFANPEYYWHYDNPQFQAEIDTADQAAPDQFVADMKKAARTLSSDAAADFLFVFPNLVVTRAGISGVAQNATSLSFDVTTIAAK
ncbi:MAG: ABC transporter substrate-binding protein [Propionibacteriaceae bacterium]|jgi:peptide/nickel transport system substrate-binding protein|nr:ABC transporter substrate-binding protein [Propionibacteriaceae bacterium]